jgi:UDPglucose 6-dehydrogenase
MSVIADRCPQIQVTVIDLNAARIAAWNDANLANLPIYEPARDRVVDRCRGSNLFFTTEVEAACAQGPTIVVEQSTLPVRKAQTVQAILAAAEGAGD